MDWSLKKLNKHMSIYNCKSMINNKAINTALSVTNQFIQDKNKIATFQMSQLPMKQEHGNLITWFTKPNPT